MVLLLRGRWKRCEVRGAEQDGKETAKRQHAVGACWGAERERSTSS
jgi:hypothetical protein